jgi:uncharacterized protein (TIGR00730 family)
MHERKMRMTQLADGFLVLPGGFGTLDETFEALTWKQLGIHDKRIVLLDFMDYYSPLLAFIEAAVSFDFLTLRSAQLLAVARDVPEALAALEHMPQMLPGDHPGTLTAA